MVVQVEDGRTFDVRFGHSLHNIKLFDTTIAPGSMFQLLNNLARSLRKRVTACSIATVIDAPNATGTTPLAQGFTICNKGEQYIREEGRRFSLIRALRNTRLPRPVQKQIAEKLGFDWELLRTHYR